MNLACFNAIPGPDHITSTRGDNFPFARHMGRERDGKETPGLSHAHCGVSSIGVAYICTY